MPTNYMFGFDASSHAIAPSQSDLASATSIYGSYMVRGDKLAAITGAFQLVAFHGVGKADFSSFKVLQGFINISGSLYGAIGFPGFLVPIESGTGITPGTFDPTLLYWVKWHADVTLSPTSARLQVSIYQHDKTTLITTLSDGNNQMVSALPSGSGLGAVCINTTMGAGWSTDTAGAFDEVHTSDNAVTDLSDFEFDEGTGTGVANTVGGGQTAAITGSGTWISLGGSLSPTDQAVITFKRSGVPLSSNQLLLYPTPETCDVTWVWKDESGVPLSPQPTGDVVSIDSDSLAASISGTVITAAYPGTCTVRITNGTNTNGLDLSVLPSFIFTGALAVT